VPGTVAQGGDGVRIGVPLQLRAIEPTALGLSVTLQALDGVREPETFVLEGRGAGSPWELQWSVPPGISTSLTLRWFDTRFDLQATDPEGLTLATYSTVLDPVEQDGDVPVTNAEYETEAHDRDQDGFSNLVELRCDSMPADPNSVPDADCDAAGGREPPTGDHDVEITGVPPGRGPAIDGRYFEPGDGAGTDERRSAWDDGAVFSDVRGERLAIDSLMIARGSGPLTETPGYRWYAVHDETTLYVFVEGKEIEAPIFGDSDQLWNDDALNLFIDGDNSGGSSYDGVDDWHVFLALTDGAGGSNTEAGRVGPGPNSVGVPDGLRFETCICTRGRHTWEIAVPLDSVGITRGEPFGFELQIDEDNDGGGRDARFGWTHPPRDAEDVDFTFERPSFMATVRLI